jgi:archaemetzincin
VKPLPRPPKVVVAPLGAVARDLVAAAGSEVARVFGVAAVAVPPQERPEYAFNVTRRQYHTSPILRRLGQLRGGEVPVIGLTDVDLFIPDAPFVFGEADRQGSAALVSTARLRHGPDGKDVDAERLRRRVAVEAVHELGQLLGLAECSDSRCAMYPSHKPSDADRKGPGLCGACRTALGLA